MNSTIKVNPAIEHVKEVKEISDIKEVAHLLSTGEWIAMSATTAEHPTFSMGRIEMVSLAQDHRKLKISGFSDGSTISKNTEDLTIDFGSDNLAVFTEKCALRIALLEQAVFGKKGESAELLQNSADSKG